MRMRQIICAVLVSVMFLTGCSSADVMETTETTVASASETSDKTEESSSVTTEPPRFEFNPHVHTDLIPEVCKDEYWEAMYNVCDAIRTGEDSFECSSKKAYEWATNEMVLGTFFPSAYMLVKGGGYKDGKGKIKYKISKDKMTARQKAFEEEITRMINESVKTDYSDFEKIVGVCDYMERNFEYDYSEIDANSADDYGTYACLMSKKGTCIELAGAYTYLLLQCGVNAVKMSEFEGLCHSWTYVVSGGKGFYVDVTWGLCDQDSDTRWNMNYFLETTQERLADGAVKEDIRPEIIWYWIQDYKSDKFDATDDTFSFLHAGARFISMDTDRKVLKYETETGEAEYFYGDKG